MRKLCHISFSSHEEVLFRSVEDINYAFNCFALSCLETESRPLADSEMTTHVHFAVNAYDGGEVFSKFRYPYSRYFNNKYGRLGRVGERYPFILEIDGLQHSLTMLSYVFRQGLHHGLSESPFGYPHNSVNAIFRKALGKDSAAPLLSPRLISKYLPRPERDIPSEYRMSTSGLLLREDVIDSAYVEELYISPRNFLYQMNRLSSSDWQQEQMEDNNGLPPITLETIEPSVYKSTMARLLQNETGRNYRPRITDLELCNIIDNLYLHQTRKKSIYELTDSARNSLGNQIYSDFKTGKVSKLLGRDAGFADTVQIRRCAAIK